MPSPERVRYGAKYLPWELFLRIDTLSSIANDDVG